MLITKKLPYRALPFKYVQRHIKRSTRRFMKDIRFTALCAETDTMNSHLYWDAHVTFSCKN